MSISIDGRLQVMGAVAAQKLVSGDFLTRRDHLLICECLECLLKLLDATLALLDLSRFDAAPLIAFTATKETDYGTETDGRIPARCGADCADQ
ncbi:hypothetical protein, partial [Pseudophaeobacter flagellatus]|nr:hypothetical protein [Pseudophaeobacter flagellatus]